jgi:ABC-type glutathione transport system ATPase component
MAATADRRNSAAGITGVSAGTGGDLFRRLSRTFSGKSQHANLEKDPELLEVDSEDDGSEKTRVEDWRLAANVKEQQINDPAESRSLGVTWTDLTVKVMPSDSRLQENVLSQFNIPQQIKEGRHKPELKTILDNSFGCVKPGEMLLVLGKPGSGCTTLLKMLANRRKGYVVLATSCSFFDTNFSQVCPSRR